jgi:hypothetical protein
MLPSSSEYVRSCQTCQRTKAEHCGPHGLLHPLPLPSRRGGMIGVDWIAGLPTTEGGFDMIQNHVDLLSGKVHAGAVPTRASATVTAADAAARRHSRHVPSVWRRLSRRAGGGPRLQVHERGVPGLRQGLGLMPHRRLCVPQEHQRQGAARQRRRQRHIAPTAARTTGTATCRSPCLPSTIRPRRSAAT